MRFRTICETCGVVKDFENIKEVRNSNNTHKQGHTIYVYRLIPEFITKVTVK